MKRGARIMCAGKAESVPRLGLPGCAGAGDIYAMTDADNPNAGDVSGRVDLRIVDKPWGHETIWARTDRYVGKVLHVKAGHALSLQYHNVKDETIFLWTGKLLFEIQEGETLVKREMLPGESVHITPHTIHRMTAIEDSDIFEVSTPELDDVVRLEDRYGRSKT